MHEVVKSAQWNDYWAISLPLSWLRAEVLGRSIIADNLMKDTTDQKAGSGLPCWPQVWLLCRIPPWARRPLEKGGVAALLPSIRRLEEFPWTEARQTIVHGSIRVGLCSDLTLFFHFTSGGSFSSRYSPTEPPTLLPQ